MGPDKAAWRAWARTTRLGLVIDHERFVSGLRAYLGATRGWVLTYRPLAGEVDLDALLGEYRCAVTRTPATGLLTVHPADAPTERHPFGFLQPMAGAPEIPIGEVAFALVPGLVFDSWGHRIGHGTGHYDRLLDRLARGVPMIGVTPKALVVTTRLPADGHDVRMTHLATEDGVTATEG